MTTTRRPNGLTPTQGYQKPDAELTREEALRLLNESRSRHAIDRNKLRKAEADLYARDAGLRRLEDEVALLKHLAGNDELTEILCRSTHEAFAAHVIVDGGGRILYSNPAAGALFGGELIGASVHEHLLKKIERRYRDPGEDTSVQPNPILYGMSLWNSLMIAGNVPAVSEGIRLHSPFKQGERHDVSFSMRRMTMADGRIRAHIEITDIEAIIKDKTTGLLLQDALINAFVRKISERVRDPELARGRRLLFLFCDLDNFKAYNEEHGYAAGNKVLRETAGAIVGELRETDMACRWFFGDELAGLVEFVSDGKPEKDAEVGLAIVNKIDAAIKRINVIWEGQVLTVTASIGFAIWRPGENYEQVVERAMEAAKASKKGGKARVTQEMVPLMVPAYLRQLP